MNTILFLSLFVAFVHAIWPIPASYSSGNETLWIDQNVQIVSNGVFQSYGSNNISSAPASSQILASAIDRARQMLFQNNFVPWKFHPRNADFEPPRAYNQKTISTITLTLNGSDAANLLRPLAGEIDESYTLSMPTSGEVEISAKSSIGLVRGLTTLSQLFYKHSKGGVYSPYAPVHITDAPKFSHRGINMDVARNWFEISDIKRMIDAAAYNKFNRFHVHVTDGQSWPLQIPALPELAGKGAYRSDLSYSPDQVDDLQHYGAMQGVSVYFEIDMPGHTSAIALSHPELIASYNIQPNWDTYAAEPPSGTLKLNSSAVYTFLETLFTDLLPRLNKYSAYFHTGGDEVKFNAYLNDETIRSNDSAVITPYLQKFLDTAHAQVRANGLTPISWEEMLLQFNLTLGKDVVVQTWQSDDAVLQTVKKGHKALAGNYNYWYLDCGKGQWLNFLPGTSSKTYYPYNDYCSPFKSWRLMYSYDPVGNIPGDLQHLVLGGETHIWAEQTDPVNIDRMVWPRAAAAAEVLWSGAKDASGQNRSQVEAAPRLSEMRERLVAKGVMAEPIQMIFCLQGDNQCSL